MSGTLTSFGRSRVWKGEGHPFSVPAGASSLSGPHCNRDLFPSSRPYSARCLPSSVKSFRQTHFFRWPSFSGTDDTHTRPGCFAWHPARGWHSTPVTSLSLPLNTRQREGGSTRTKVTAGFQYVNPIPHSPGWLHRLLLASRPLFPCQKGSYHSASALGTNGTTACLEAGGWPT